MDAILNFAEAGHSGTGRQPSCPSRSGPPADSRHRDFAEEECHRTTDRCPVHAKRSVPVSFPWIAGSLAPHVHAAADASTDRTTSHRRSAQYGAECSAGPIPQGQSPPLAPQAGDSQPFSGITVSRVPVRPLAKPCRVGLLCGNFSGRRGDEHARNSATCARILSS